MIDKIDELRGLGAIALRGLKLCVDLWYPRAGAPGAVDAIQVGLCDVRAADSLLITYDFDRDGYVIKQASVFSWEADDDVCDPDWQEVAFIQAWAREKPDGDDGR